MLTCDKGPVGDLLEYLLPIEEDYNKNYIATVAFAWINSR